MNSVIQDTKFNFTFFADDIALLAESREDLQKLVDAAFTYSESWRLNGIAIKVK